MFYIAFPTLIWRNVTKYKQEKIGVTKFHLMLKSTNKRNASVNLNAKF